MQGYEFHYVYSRKITWTELLINYGTGRKKKQQNNPQL